MEHFDPRTENFRVAQISFGIEDIYGPGNKPKLSKWFDSLTAGINSQRENPTMPARCILLRRNTHNQIATMARPRKPINSGWDMQQGKFNNPGPITNMPIGKLLTRMRNLEMPNDDEYQLTNHPVRVKFLAIMHADDAKLDYMFNNIRRYSFPRVVDPGPGDKGWEPGGGNFISDLFRLKLLDSEFSSGDIGISEWKDYNEWMRFSPHNKLFDPFNL